MGLEGGLSWTGCGVGDAGGVCFWALACSCNRKTSSRQNTAGSPWITDSGQEMGTPIRAHSLPEERADPRMELEHPVELV